MAKRHSTKSRRRTHTNVLEVRVMSPRIAWIKFLRVIGKLTKVACVLAALAGVSWAVWQGVQRAFYQNPDFRLQVIDLNANSVIDETRLAEVTQLDLTASIFNIKVDELEAKLKALPEISAVHAERRLPGTLMVRVVPRLPQAWISCPESSLAGERRVGGLLVDHDGIVYPCPKLQLKTASSLPIIELPASPLHPFTPGQPVTSAELRHCFHLLDAACKADSEAIRGIQSIRQVNAWSLELTTRDGTVATFGLGDHDRQIANLQASLEHANEKGYSIATINLIPKYNIPITVRNDYSAPKAIPVAEPSPSEIRQDRRARDLSNLLNRN